MPIHAFTLIIIPMIIFFAILGVLLTVFWIWMLVDCVLNKKLTEGQKVLWMLLMIFTHLIGATIYFFVGHLPSRKQISYVPYPVYIPKQEQAGPYSQGYRIQNERPPYQNQSSEQQINLEQVPYEAYEQPQAGYPEQRQEQ